MKLNKSGKPLYTREGEKVGGGFFVFRRGAYGNRIKPSKLPFEHPTKESAFAELERLKKDNPQLRYSVFQEIVPES